MNNEQVFHLLHIGKTGGTAVKYALNHHLEVLVDGGNRNKKTATVSLPDISSVFHLHPHDVHLRDIPEGEKIVFFLRDPANRFISSFYSREREGKPRYYFPWKPEEAISFKHFPTANQLANGLGSDNPEVAGLAAEAMQSIFHVKTSFWDWFEDEDYFLSRKEDIFFVGFQESLNADFERLKSKLKLPETVQLPTSDADSHKEQTGQIQQKAGIQVNV